MNSRTQTFDLSVEGRQVEEAVSSIFHTVLLYRTLGKFKVTPDGTYSIGTVGYQDVDCDFIDLTYLCCSSPTLQDMLHKEISSFSQKLRNDQKGYGHINLEFFQRKKSHWPFAAEKIPWEVWTLRVQLVNQYTEDLRETVGMYLAEKILEISGLVGTEQFLPGIPVYDKLDTVFIVSFEEVQPYHFHLYSSTADCYGNFSMRDRFGRIIQTTMGYPTMW